MVAQHGLVRLCAFILQSLTAERGFGDKLNAPVRMHGAYLRSKYGMQGSLADFMIEVSVLYLPSVHYSRTDIMCPFLVHSHPSLFYRWLTDRHIPCVHSRHQQRFGSPEKRFDDLFFSIAASVPRVL
jgi:hypothetical protein